MEKESEITIEEQQLRYQRKKLYRDIDNLDVIMKKTNKQINILTEKIQDLCTHKYVSESVYGEKTRHECIKCGHWY